MYINRDLVDRRYICFLTIKRIHLGDSTFRYACGIVFFTMFYHHAMFYFSHLNKYSVLNIHLLLFSAKYLSKNHFQQKVEEIVCSIQFPFTFVINLTISCKSATAQCVNLNRNTFYIDYSDTLKYKYFVPVTVFFAFEWCGSLPHWSSVLDMSRVKGWKIIFPHG